MFTARQVVGAVQQSSFVIWFVAADVASFPGGVSRKYKDLFFMHCSCYRCSISK